MQTKYTKEDERQFFRKRIRRHVLKRDKHGCRICKTKKNLTVHHIESLAKCFKENKEDVARNLNNLVTLCESCHENAPNGKKAYNEWEQGQIKTKNK